MTSEQARKEQAQKMAEEAGVKGPEIVPTPAQPMKVVRHILETDNDWPTPSTLCRWQGSWMRWEGPHWAEVDSAELKKAYYARLENAVYMVPGKNGPTAMPWAPNRRKVNDLTDATEAQVLMPSTMEPPCWLNRGSTSNIAVHDTVISHEGGLLRVADRSVTAHTPDFFNVVSVPFAYNHYAPPPQRWLQFLKQVWPDDPEAIAALQEFFGYVISGRTDLHKVMLIVGPTRSGKGTIGRTLTAMVGRGNMAGPTLSSLATNFGLSTLIGKPLAIISDARLGSGRDGSGHKVVERLLTISGEDTIDCDRKYRDPWTGRLPTRFLILSNEIPNFGDASGTIAHRFVVLQMTASWLGKEDTTLESALTTEMPGILNWALDGLVRLEQNGHIIEPQSSIDAVVNMKDSASPMSAFVRECCVVERGAEVAITVLYNKWRAWCELNGRDKPGNLQQFGRSLHATVAGLKIYRPHGGERSYRGIRPA